MGAKCCEGDYILRQPVTFLSNQIPNLEPYKQYKSNSIRFQDITVRRKNQNIFVFTMHVKNSPQIVVQLPVLNEQLHCALATNYQLKINHKMVVDIFHKQYNNTLTDVQNQKDRSNFSMKIIPFKGYNSQDLKLGLYELWLHKKLEKTLQTRRKINFYGNIVKVADSYIFSMNEQRQALVILFQQVTTSLANIAQYRLKANWHWSRQQKLYIICQIIQSYDILYSNSIVHRNIRPSNIFYVPRNQSYAFGNLRYGRFTDKNEEDLMTVVGVPFFVEDTLEILMSRKQQSGFYSGLAVDYQGLRSIVNILQNCNILDKNPQFRTEQLAKLSEMLTKNQSFQNIKNYVQFIKDSISITYGQNIGDTQISSSAHYLLAHTHRKFIEESIFQHFYNLGYNKHFSDMAHKMIDKNIEANRELDNAPLLKRLGQFYQSNGGKGNQYFYNSFALYLKKADNKINYEKTDDAQQQLDQAKNVYLKLNQGQGSQSGMIEIKRVQALILHQRKRRKDALTMIKKVLTQGAQQNLPVQNQSKLLLAYAKILNGNCQSTEAIKALQNGLSICSNSVQFKSPSSCRIHKSHFLFQIGRTYLDEISKNYNPQKPKNQQTYSQQLNGQAQSNLRSALQIMQNENSSEFDIAEVLYQLGYLYYLNENFFQAKQYYKKALTKYKSIRNQIPSIKMARCEYFYGTSNYYLNEFHQAKEAYQNSIQLLKKISQQKLLLYNIEGNLALAMMELNQWESGQKLLFESLQKIKRSKTQQSYDYVALLARYKKIKPPLHHHQHRNGNNRHN